MTEVFDCFFPENEKSDYQVADVIFRVVKAIREGNNDFYEEVIKSCDEARKRMGDHFELKGDDSDSDEDWGEEGDDKDNTDFVKVDVEQFKKKKKEKMQVDMDEDMLNKMKNAKGDDDDEDWNSV